MESLPAALRGCPDWLGEVFSTSSLQQGLSDIPLGKAEGNAAELSEVPWLAAPGELLDARGMFPAGFYTLMAVLMSEWKGSAAFFKH